MSQSTSNVREELEELRSSVMSIRAEVRRMEACIENFRTKYEPLLQAMAVSSSYWGTVRRELLLHALKGSLWAMIGATVVIVGVGLQRWAKEWLA